MSETTENVGCIELSGLMRFLATVGISLGAFMFVLDYTVANVAIPYIAGGLATGVDQGTYVLTFFTVGNAVFLPMTGWLSNQLGLVRTYIWSLIFFTIFSAACGMALDLFSLVVFRFLQGAAAGPLIPVAQSLLTMIFPPKKLQMVMAIFSLVVLVAPVLGPIVGGYFCVFWTWRWIFMINIPVGIICIFLIWLTLSPYNKVGKSLSIDYVSVILLIIGMTALQLFLDKGQQWDWFRSDKVRVCAFLAFVGITYLILWGITHKKPLMHFYLFKIRNFTISCILIFFSYSLYMGTVVIIPLWLQMYKGYDAFWAGIAVSPLGFAPVALAPFVAKISQKLGPAPPLFIGFLAIGLASLYTSYFTSGVSLYLVMYSRFLFGIGIAFFMIPMISMPALALPRNQDELSNGLGIFHFIRGVSGGIGISTYQTMFERRTIHQHFNIIEHVNNYRLESREYLENIHSYGFNGKSLIEVANNLVDEQAAAIALDEVSMAITWVCLALCIIVLFAKKEKPAEGAGPVISD